MTAGQTLSISFYRSPGYARGTVTMVDIAVVAEPVPEPATAALMLGGLDLVGWLGRRRLS